jgi:hypothetical protein
LPAVEVVSAGAGLALFLFPGAAWTLALAPRMGWMRAAPLALVLAFTVAPAALFVLNVAFDAPLTLGPIALLTTALGMAGLAVRAAGPVLRSVSG